MQEKAKEIGSRVREMRKLSHLSTAEMAEYLNIPVETY